MKRVRQVYSTDEIAHIWAHQHDSPTPVHYARNPNGNFYFDGDIIYSYGTHFPIAKLVKNRRDPAPIVLFTTRDYSNTTAQHKRRVSNAVSHLTLFYVRDVNDPNTTFKEKAKSIKGMLKEAQKTKSVLKANILLTGIKQIVHDVNRWRDHRGIASRICVPELVEPLLVALMPKLEAHNVRVAQANEIRRRNNEKKWAERSERWKAEAAEWERWRMMPPEEQRADFMKRLEAWENGEPDINLRNKRPEELHTPWMRCRHPNSSHAVVETTLGAHVPLAEVTKVWAKIQTVMATGIGWEHNGETLPVGHFQVEKIQPDGSLVAGCHQFSAEAILRFAKKLGWYEPKTTVA